ncbi:TPA: hypothetical protein L3H12_002548 [Acinetobacter baumannii]|uniref:hypothetical protein n=1 Tax=Acinetobacter baumannii TaxID=470 RepID=UPI0003FD99EB|nr:hypothetical protein [Acinetobacter baumannii]RSP32473.1 hypothetical protein EA730_09245 [Acinetobacter baumannii]HBN5965815.1 hypothetical protein [Acinetobacter baumannii]
MAKKSINEKIKNVGKWSICGVIGYLILAFILKSKYPISHYGFNQDNAYDVIKEALTLAAAFLAPIAAFLLFSDWREQHNKQVRNEFALKVFNQFENFSTKINQAGYTLLDLEIIIPKESSNFSDPDRIPLYLDNPIFTENGKLLKSYENQILAIHKEFNILLEKLRVHGFVINQAEKIDAQIAYFLKKFGEIHSEEDDSYSEYLQFIQIANQHIHSYENLRNEIEQLIVSDILSQLQET